MSTCYFLSSGGAALHSSIQPLVTGSCSTVQVLNTLNSPGWPRLYWSPGIMGVLHSSWSASLFWSLIALTFKHQNIEQNKHGYFHCHQKNIGERQVIKSVEANIPETHKRIATNVARNFQSSMLTILNERKTC